MTFTNCKTAMRVSQKRTQKAHRANLGGGFQYFSFSPLFGEDSHFDSYFSKGLKPPTSNTCSKFVWSCFFVLSQIFWKNPWTYQSAKLIHLRWELAWKKRFPAWKMAQLFVDSLVFVCCVKRITRWWLQTFFIFIPTWGNDPIWLIFFRWVETTN